MPPRWLSVLIVAAWLATGWFFWRDQWPNWRSGEPPKFHIDLVDEVQNQERLITTWNVLRQRKNDEKPQALFGAKTWVVYQSEDDSFTLHAELKAKGKETFSLLTFAVKTMTSEYRVTRGGQLRELRSRVGLASLPPTSPKEKGIARHTETTEENAHFLLWGEVRGDRFFAHCQASAALAPKLLEMDLPPVSVAHNASVLLPLHPVNRIHGLRLGQSWRQPLVDPIRDALGSLHGLGGGIHYLNARVLSRPQVLTRDDDSEATCLVIEYEDEGEFVGRTWVEQDSEHVEQQEVLLAGDHWFMKRDDPRKAAKRRLRAMELAPRLPAVDPEP